MDPALTDDSTPAWVRLIREPLTQYERDTVPELGAKLLDPPTIARVLHQRVAEATTEQMWVVAFDAQCRLLWLQVVSVGILNASLCHPREVYRAAVKFGACGIVVAHNHPSGSIEPSTDDDKVTKQLVAAGKLLDIPLYDHLILTHNGQYYSYAEKGRL